jgi:hypothetical protein
MWDVNKRKKQQQMKEDKVTDSHDARMRRGRGPTTLI